MNDLYFCGDIHGEFRKLVWEICNKYEIHNSSILVLGDFGIGFGRDFPDIYKRTEPKLEKNNITIYTIRGNHDDPQYFKNTEKHNYPRLKFLEDHNVYRICDRDIYVIGGANSTDANINPDYTGNIEDRKIETEKRLRKGKLATWWEDEAIEEKYTNLPPRVDIIVSHCAPINFEPVSIRTSEISVPQFERIIQERKYLMNVLQEIRADYWFYGHYHRSYTGTYNQLLYRGLGVFELFLAPPKKNTNPQGEI